MKLRPSTLDRIATAYAEAVAAGDFDSAEGWLATAVFVAERQIQPAHNQGRRTLVAARSHRRFDR